jgi:hypothetical protein
MSTNSRIFIKENNTYDGIYCHWDGDIEGVGMTLHNHYQDFEKIRMLLTLGNLSVLEEEIGKRHDFINPKDGWCISYGRDRGDKDNHAITLQESELNTFLDCHDNIEYLYVYDTKDSTWYAKCLNGDRNKDNLKPLKDLL